MKMIMQCALLAVAMLAAAPVMAQSNAGGQSASVSVGGPSDGGGNGSGGGGSRGGGGDLDGGGNSRLERLNVVCVSASCNPRRRRPPLSLNYKVNGDLCGQQLTFGRDAIFYYERCDSRM